MKRNIFVDFLMKTRMNEAACPFIHSSKKYSGIKIEYRCIKMFYFESRGAEQQKFRELRKPIAFLNS